MKIIAILGARPQFIKAATVSRALKKQNINEIIIHTGQHYDANMSQIFFDEMEIPQPDYNLEISGLNHGAMTGRMLEKIEDVLLKEKPDYVLVYGDTNSTLAGALAAAKLHIPVAHVEAGLRSFEMKMPEEINRILTDRISSILFCPTQTAIKNLEAEGFRNFNCKIEQPGDVMYDAVLHYKAKIENKATVIKSLGLRNGSFVLATLHRAENTNDEKRLREICRAINEINSHTKVILPLHPRTKAFIESLHIKLEATLISPVGYFDMLALLDNCKLVMTDSGGLQKEAYFFSKFCITLRDQTEWVELVETRTNELVGADFSKILNAFKGASSAVFATQPLLYGNGAASELIAESLVKL